MAFAQGTKGGAGGNARTAGKQKEAAKPTSQGQVGANVASKFVFPYDDGTFSIGARHADAEPSLPDHAPSPHARLVMG